MKKIIELKLGVSLLTITFSMLGGINQAIAQTCTTPPSCDTLGYKQSASDCTGQQVLKCPFDNSKVFCGGAACPDDYTVIGCETKKGSYVSCGSKCKYKSCNPGWNLSNGDCVPASCTGYALTSCDVNVGTCDSCLSGTENRYKYIACNTNKGWCPRPDDRASCLPNRSSCPENLYVGYCSEFLTNNLTTSKNELNKKGTTSTCWYGGLEYIYNTNCFDGSTPVSGRCDGKNPVCNGMARPCPV